MGAGNMSNACLCRTWALVIAALVTVVPVAASLPVVQGGGLPPVSLSYSVQAGAYDNAVRVGNVTDMHYPRIVVDRGPASPYRGTVYVLGLGAWAEGTTCPMIVVARSFDGGQTFEAPRPTTKLCTYGPSLSVGIDGSGTLYAAGWGPVVARSSDSGLSWTTVADLRPCDCANTPPASLVVDPVTDAVYVVWAPSDDVGVWSLASGPIRMSTSRDGGGSWTAPVDILPNGTAGARPQVASFMDSVVVTFRLGDGPSGLYVAAVASQDGGRQWGAPIAVDAPDPCQAWPEPSTAASLSGLFAISWTAMTGSLGCSGQWGASTESWVAVSRDRGRTFSAPVNAGGPPAWIGAGFGGAVAFDDASQLFVTWRSIASANWTGTVYVANSTDLETFENASFALRLETGGSNATAEENLAPGLNGIVYLAWTVFRGSGPETGIYVRAITGEAEGELVLHSDFGPDPIDVDLRDSITNESRARVRWTGGRASVPGLPPGAYYVWLLGGTGSARAGAIPVRTWGLTSFTLEVGVGAGPAFPWTIPLGLAVGVALLGAALASLHYTRIAREQVLQRKVRLLMCEYVRDNPGASFAAVRDAMGLKNGVAAYHLGVLETQGLLHSESKRRHRWYYTNGAASVWKDLPLSPLQSSIIDAVRRSPGIGVRELARTLGRRSSPVAYNVTMLAREGVLRTERAGRMLHCYPAE